MVKGSLIRRRPSKPPGCRSRRCRRRTWRSCGGSPKPFSGELEHDDPAGHLFDTGLLADDAEWVVRTPFEGKSVWRGRQEWVEFFRAWTGEFEDYSIQFEPVIDAGDDRVVAIYRQRATGKGSGVPVEWHGGMVIELRGWPRD